MAALTVACGATEGEVLSRIGPDGSSGGPQSLADGSVEGSTSAACTSITTTAATGATIELGGFGSSATVGQLTYHVGDTAWAATIDANGALAGAPFVIGDGGYVFDSDVAASGASRCLTFQDHALQGRWRIFSGSFVSGVAIDLGASTVVSAGTTESVGARIASLGGGFGVAFRQDDALAFATLDGACAVRSLVALPVESGLPAAKRTVATNTGYLVIAERVGFELEWFSAAGDHANAGPRLDATALDVGWGSGSGRLAVATSDQVSVSPLAERSAAPGGALTTFVAGGNVRAVRVLPSAVVLRDDANRLTVHALDGGATATLSSAATAGPLAVSVAGADLVAWVDATPTEQALRVRRLCP